jgi:hypothetical protein
MNKKTIIWAVGFSSAAVAACVILFFTMKLSWRESMKLPAPRPDTIATRSAHGGDVFIENETAGYAITIPRDWYLEKSSGSGMAVYPDYDASGKTEPACKMEISILPNPDRKNLADWLTAYLHEDPTADVSETSRTATTTYGAPAIVWRGVQNGAAAMLAYVANGTTVCEIAPSAILGTAGPAADTDCEGALENILENFQFTK